MLAGEIKLDHIFHCSYLWHRQHRESCEKGDTGPGPSAIGERPKDLDGFGPCRRGQFAVQRGERERSIHGQ